MQCSGAICPILDVSVNKPLTILVTRPIFLRESTFEYMTFAHIEVKQTRCKEKNDTISIFFNKREVKDDALL